MALLDPKPREGAYGENDDQRQAQRREEPSLSYFAQDECNTAANQREELDLADYRKLEQQQ
jgi:hypothetical protein